MLGALHIVAHSAKLIKDCLYRACPAAKIDHKRHAQSHPDIVLRKYRTCVFVNGCFWHGHDGCKYFVMPKTNTEFWEKKISRNIERDKEEQKKLAEMGWHVIVIWECELKPDIREKTLASLAFTLNHIFLQDHSIAYPRIDEGKDLDIAAETSTFDQDICD